MPEQQNSARAAAIITALREASNAGLVQHDVGPVAAILQDDAKILRSDGSLVIGAAAMARGFETNFADPTFVSYVRTPETITMDSATAAEAGSWIGQWTDRSIRGSYLARWALTPDGWRIVSELFI